MKKLLTRTITLLPLGICLHAQQQNFIYEGPPDDTYWTGESDYSYLFPKTTLGTLARYSDAIGVGKVSNKIDDHLTVTVDHALVGCTNGASIVMYEPLTCPRTIAGLFLPCLRMITEVLE